ncbi:MAG: hypothetical protein HDR01_10200 [Lachnospiraceae bacterium]|nr:hypothetical protein [Lachnospiraceae bacterium]
MKKRKKVFLAGIMLIFLFLSGLMVRQVLALQNADCVVRVDIYSFLYSPHEYYAISEKGAVKVPEFLAKQFCGESIVTKSIYDDNDRNYWFVELEYAEDVSCFTGENYVDTAWGEHYRVTYQGWTPSTESPGKEEEQLFRKMAEAFHSGNPYNPEERTSYGGGITGLAYFFVVNHQERHLFVKNSKVLYFVTDTGEFIEVMSRPEDGYFRYYCFRSD